MTESIRNNAFLQNAETLKEDFNKCKKNNVILQKFAQLRKESQKGIDLLRNSVIENRKTLNQSKMFLNNLKNKLEKKKITKDDYSEMVSSIRGSAFI